MSSTIPSSAAHRSSLRPPQTARSVPVWNLRVLSSREELKGVASAWKRLTPNEAAPFQTAAWNLAWYEEFREEYDEILVLVTSFGSEERAILPCYRKGKEIRLAADHLCDYQDVVALTESDAAKALDFALSWLRRKRPDCRFFLEKVSSEGWLHRLLLSERKSLEGFLLFSKFFAPCPTVEIREGLEGYLQSLPGKTRQDFKRSLQRLGRECPRAKVKILRSREIGLGKISELAHFHDRHFRKDGVSPCRDLRWHRLFARVARDPEVGLQVATLATPEGILAIDFGFARGRRYYGYLTAFDLRYRKWAPGKCLLLQRFDAWTMVDGVKELDFLSGNETYKRGFTHGDRYEVSSFLIMPTNLSNRIRKTTLAAEMMARSVARLSLRRLGLRK